MASMAIKPSRSRASISKSIPLHSRSSPNRCRTGNTTYSYILSRLTLHNVFPPARGFSFIVFDFARNPARMRGYASGGGYNVITMSGMEEERIYSVGEVNRLADNLLQGLVVWVEGRCATCAPIPTTLFQPLG